MFEFCRNTFFRDFKNPISFAHVFLRPIDETSSAEGEVSQFLPIPGAQGPNIEDPLSRSVFLDVGPPIIRLYLTDPKQPFLMHYCSNAVLR